MKQTLTVVSILLLASLLAFAAGLSGTWNIQAIGASGGPQQLILTANGNSLTGTLDGVAISGGGVGRSSFWFIATRNGVTYRFKGTLTGDTLELHQTINQQDTRYNYTRAGS